MAVSIEDIKTLRDRTGVSMSACKSALEESGGDIEKAIDVLRKKGEAKAAKSSERSTAEGTVAIVVKDGKCAVLELLCETDFVGRSDEFKAMANDIAGKILSGEISPGSTDVPGLSDAVIKLGENIQLSRSELLQGSNIGSYIHSNGKIGVVVVLDGGDEETAKDVAMHVAATNPAVISPDEVPQDLVAREKEIWRDQLAKEGKPAEIVDKIMEGKERKFREESALLKQSFVKNPEQTIEQFLNGVKVLSFTRYSI